MEKYRLCGSARLVHCCAAIAAAANLLLVLFLLNGRIAADTILVVHGKVAPFEWVGKFKLELYQMHVISIRANPSPPLPCAVCYILCCLHVEWVGKFTTLLVKLELSRQHLSIFDSISAFRQTHLHHLGKPIFTI